MRYKLLGKSGLRVSELCLGTMTFGEDWGWGASKEESRKMFNAFAEAGGNFVDTANGYTFGTSESYLGEFVAENRDRFVVATKYTLSTNPADPNAGGNHRKSMVHSVENSLKRMNTDYIDLLWVHCWDFMTPTEETMRALDDLVRAGKVLYIGVSDTPAWVVSRSNTLAELRGWSQFVGLQINYSLLERAPERDLLPMAHALDIGVTCWGILGAGVLTGKYAKDQSSHSRGPMAGNVMTERNLKIADEVVKIAAELGCTPSQVAINWVRQQPYGVMLPILGVRKMSQLEDNLGSLNFKLDDDQLDRLNQLSQIELGFPHDFLNRDMLKMVTSGAAYLNFDFHRQTIIRDYWKYDSAAIEQVMAMFDQK